MHKITCVAVSLLSLLSVPAFGGYWRGWHHHCEDHAEAVSTILDQTIDAIIGSCNLVPLKLERTPDGPLTVDAWTGGYDLIVTMTTTYRIDHYDRCAGAFLWSEEQKGKTKQTLHFNVDNPNLGPDLPSYISNAPMTDQEAQEALPEALRSCNAVHAGPWLQSLHEALGPEN